MGEPRGYSRLSVTSRDRRRAESAKSGTGTLELTAKTPNSLSDRDSRAQVNWPERRGTRQHDAYRRTVLRASI